MSPEVEKVRILDAEGLQISVVFSLFSIFFITILLTKKFSELLQMLETNKMTIIYLGSVKLQRNKKFLIRLFTKHSWQGHMFSPPIPHFNYFVYFYVVFYSPATDESISTIRDAAIHQLIETKKDKNRPTSWRKWQVMGA